MRSCLASRRVRPLRRCSATCSIGSLVTGLWPPGFRRASAQQTPEALDWYVPERAQFALLPTTSAWLSVAWLDYYGEEDKAVLAACLRQWHEKWGAEIVASWGTMMQFVTPRRPEFGPDAVNLAYQQLTLAGNIGLLEIDLARILSHVDTWFLHARP